MVTRYVITGTPRSGKNSQRIVQRPTGGRFLIKSKAAAGWMERAVAELCVQRKRTPALACPCRVDLTIYQSGATPDADNVQSLVWDALVRADILTDDSLIDAGAFQRVRGVGKPQHRVEIVITPCREVRDAAA